MFGNFFTFSKTLPPKTCDTFTILDKEEEIHTCLSYFYEFIHKVKIACIHKLQGSVKSMKRIVLVVIPLVLILLVIWMKGSTVKESIIYFPIDEDARFESATTFLSLEEKKRMVILEFDGIFSLN